jgi:hypothetical protein
MVDEPCDAVHDDAGFARTRPGQNEEGAFAMGHRLLLRGVEMFENIHVASCNVVRCLILLADCVRFYHWKESAPDAARLWKMLKMVYRVI